MPDPTITIRNRKGPIAGHFWTELDDGQGTKTVGSFGPRSIEDVRGALASTGLVPGMSADGEFKSGDILRDANGRPEDSFASATVPISPEGYAAAKQRIEAASDDHKLDYRGLGPNPNNCIDATQDILTRTGRPESVADFFTAPVLNESPAGVVAMHRAGVRADDAATVAEFPDMAFPWPPQARSDAHVLPAPAERARVNFLNSAQVERMTLENLLNAAPYSENLLNAANGLRAMGY
jgi:hypothetical protein